jgi:Arc/MetJ-type ribon-helix-helix transcriptional regulator
MRMEKTTVYLPADLKRAIARLARARKCSDAEVIRDALARLVAASESPAPKLPLFRSRGESIAHQVDEVLAKGFGRE